jgi:alkaline phosphatase
MPRPNPLLPRLLAIGVMVLPAVACAPLPRPDAVNPRPTVVPAPNRVATAESPQAWFEGGARAAQANLVGAAARARNVIVFLGDGMSIPTITAARILDGQRKGGSGEGNRLAFEHFPATALSRTYETDYQTPDSAGTMTAIMSGVKTRDGVIGIDQEPVRGDCAASRGHELVSLLELAEAARLSTGVVTTARVTHATPAATYGHLPERDWEDDSRLTPAARAQGCIDFARQLVEFPVGDGIDVVLGGGRRGFMPTRQSDPEYPRTSGRRNDGRDLVAEWRRRTGGTYVWNTRGLEAADPQRTGKLLGLFEPGHMRYEHERAADPGGEPDLARMTRAAIALLAGNPRGYVLVVEAGRIDHAHHAGNAWRALEETIVLSRAVQAAVEATSVDDTLILVTADHSHTLTFAGYPARGNPILGKVRHADGVLARDAAGLPYTTLGYANGPGHAGASDAQPEGTKRFPHEPERQAYASGRPDLSRVDTTDPDFMQEATLPLGSESHAGDDVAVYARGPGSDGVRGSLEQNVLFHLMAQSAPALREALCALGACDAHGMPVRRPDHAALLQRDAAAPAR